MAEPKILIVHRVDRSMQLRVGGDFGAIGIEIPIRSAFDEDCIDTYIGGEVKDWTLRGISHINGHTQRAVAICAICDRFYFKLGRAGCKLCAGRVSLNKDRRHMGCLCNVACKDQSKQ